MKLRTAIRPRPHPRPSAPLRQCRDIDHDQVANPTGLHSFQPHVHLYLADRYGRLAIAYRRRSRLSVADRLEAKARLHFDLGGGDEPPPAAALALGSAQRQVVVEADGTVDPTQQDSKLLPFVPKKPTDWVQVNRCDV